MPNIVIKELFGSDDILKLTEKINYNFDQLIAAGGGPEGPIGLSGIQGVAGPEGVRGSQWFGASGATGTTNVPTDNVFRNNDFKLNINGDVDYYNSNSWLTSNINLKGPTGPKGATGDGSVDILPGKLQSSDEGVQFTPDFEKMGAYLSGNFDDDNDDNKINSSTFINSGLDFVSLGRGNNCLVLGRYASLFRNNATGVMGGDFSPAIGNKPITHFPNYESDIPMSIISQNDYKDPSDINSNFSNGIAFGLTKTHTTVEYNAGTPYSAGEMDYDDFTKMGISNRFFDFNIESKSMLTLGGNSSSFRLGDIGIRNNTINVHNISTRLNSDIYTEFNIKDSFVIDLKESSAIPNRLGIILKDDYFYTEQRNIFTTSQSTKDLRKKISRAFFTKSQVDSNGNNTYSNEDSNELVLSNKSYLGNISTGPTGSIDKIDNFYYESYELDSNVSTNPYRLGQAIVNVKLTAIQNNIPFYPRESNINLNYSGFGYDQAFVSYSGIDDNYTNSQFNNINRPQDGFERSLYGIMIQNEEYRNHLGYDIESPLIGQEGSRSMARMGIYPGLFKQEMLSTGIPDDTNDPNGTNRKDKFFDVAHKMLPTGSLDLFGTIRLRQQETTDEGAEDGFIAINKKDGIITFEEPNLVNATPTYSIQMFGEHASDKFSFFTQTSKQLGHTATGLKAIDYKLGGTGTAGAFIGKGSDELKDYYICNGAVLADARDILVTGPFSKMKGMNIKTTTTTIENGDIGGGINSTLLYSINNDFIGKNNENHSDLLHGDDLLSNVLLSKTEDIRMQDPSWGYSILAPSNKESGFRVCLPNYFGRVAKMNFPDSDFIIRAVSGNFINSEENDIMNLGDSGAGYRFYKTDNTYNNSWMMKGSFESLGFPYIIGNQLPYTKTSYQGQHTHNWSFNKKDDLTTSQFTDYSGFASKLAATDEDTNYPANFTLGSAGNHNHIANTFTRVIANIGGVLGPQMSSYTVNNWFSTYKHQVLSNIESYSTNSNWIQKPQNISGPDKIGQRFITPSFKGTYMAINLKGVRNPNRGANYTNNNKGTLIKDFHYIAGVPLCSGIVNDMSWWSYLGTPEVLIDEAKYTSTGYVYDCIRGSGWSFKLNAYKFGFQSIARNDDTMHPYTYFDSVTGPTTGSIYETPLEYNNDVYTTSNWRKYSSDLYKTNVHRPFGYDTN